MTSALSDAAPARAQRPWAAIVAATLLNLPLGSLYAFSLFLQPMEALLQVGRKELSIVFGLATIGTTLGMNLAPRLFGLAPPWLLIAGCTIAGTVGLLLAAAARGLLELAIGYGLLFGIGGGAAYILVQQGINLMVTRHRGLLNGYMVGLYPAGAMIAAPLFAWALELWGVRATLVGLAVMLSLCGTLCTLLVIFAGLRLPPRHVKTAQNAADNRRGIFALMWVVFFLAAAAGLTVLSQAAGIVRAYGGTAAIAVFATTAITGAIAAARMGGGLLVDRFAVPHVMAGAHALAFSGTVLLTLWPSPVSAMVGLAMIGCGYGFISGATAGAIGYYWEAAAYGRTAGRLYIAWCVAAISLPVLAGHLYDLTGGYAATVLIAGAGNLAGFALALALPRHRR